MDAMNETPRLKGVPSLDALVNDPDMVEQLPLAVVRVLWITLGSLERVLELKLFLGAEKPREDRLLNIEEAAAILGKTKDWLYRRAERLPFTAREGRLLRFSNNGIQQYIRQRVRRR